MAKKGGLYVYQQIAKTKAEWEAENPIVPDRVLIWETDTLVVKIGDGKTHYNDLLDRMTSGKAPRVSEETDNWQVWNVVTRQWDDTGICAYPGKAPRINPDTENWENWDDEQRKFVDTGIYAKTPGAPRISSKNTWEVWDPETRSFKDSGLGVVLATNIDGGKPGSIYTPEQVMNFGKIKA